MQVAPKGMRLKPIGIGDLPLYNEDLDASPPASWTRLRKEIAAADGVLFLTPEYNRSIPGCLKNAIDIGSRPDGKSGDGTLVHDLSPASGSDTFFPPNGGAVVGAAKVVARYDKDVKAFSPAGKRRSEILQSGASGEVGFWTGFQLAEVELGGKAMKMKLRVTELFRKIGGEWKLIHRPADSASEPEH
jgi:hypothetical protein